MAKYLNRSGELPAGHVPRLAIDYPLVTSLAGNSAAFCHILFRLRLSLEKRQSCARDGSPRLSCFFRSRTVRKIANAGQVLGCARFNTNPTIRKFALWREHLLC